MHSKHKPALQRMALVGAVGAVALLGNMRASGSQGSPGADASASLHAVAPGSPIGADGVSYRKDLGTRDDARLVPAIYAWDPDVRFVYYRHVSKWM